MCTRTSSRTSSKTHCLSNMNEGIMRLRHWSTFAPVFLLICIGAVGGDRSTAGAALFQATRSAGESPVQLPNKEGSLKFIVLGDFGTGERAQYQLAEQMATLRGRFKYDLVVLVGDNLYGAER